MIELILNWLNPLFYCLKRKQNAKRCVLCSLSKPKPSSNSFWAVVCHLRSALPNGSKNFPRRSHAIFFFCYNLKKNLSLNPPNLVVRRLVSTHLDQSVPSASRRSGGGRSQLRSGTACQRRNRWRARTLWSTAGTATSAAADGRRRRRWHRLAVVEASRRRSHVVRRVVELEQLDHGDGHLDDAAALEHVRRAAQQVLWEGWKIKNC